MSKIFCLGPAGTFSFQAASKYNQEQKHEIVTLVSIEEVFNELLKSVADYSVIPIENTLAGVVGVHQDLLVKYCQNDNVHIVSEIDCQIRFALLTNTQDLTQVHYIYSHPHAIEQCQIFKMQYLPTAQIKFAKSTVASAKYFLDKKDTEPTAAIIPLEYLKHTYELQPFAYLKQPKAGIQDVDIDITRFFIISKQQGKVKYNFNCFKTSIFIETISDEPALLFNILSPLANLKINMSFLHSRASIKMPGIYNFFIDFINKKDHPADSELLLKILDRLEMIKVTLLGTYNSKLSKNGD